MKGPGRLASALYQQADLAVHGAHEINAQGFDALQIRIHEVQYLLDKLRGQKRRCANGHDTELATSGFIAVQLAQSLELPSLDIYNLLLQEGQDPRKRGGGLSRGESDLEPLTDEEEAITTQMNDHTVSRGRFTKDERPLNEQVPITKPLPDGRRGVFGARQFIKEEADTGPWATLSLQDMVLDLCQKLVVSSVRIRDGVQGIDAKGGGGKRAKGAVGKPDAPGAVVVTALLGDEQRLVAVTVKGARGGIVVQVDVRRDEIQ
ncbi:glycoside hydrolase family 35 protein, partial [Aureobasidium melanogenum]